MRLGLIARCRERGLGTLTAEFARHIDFDKVLVVQRDDVDYRDDERFPGARWARLARNGELPHEAVRWITSDVDAVLSFETFYDDRVIEAARRNGVGTVLCAMHEYNLYRHDRAKPRPDLFLAPSPWCLDEWPKPVEFLPVPVATDRFTTREVTQVRTVVHAAGAYAKGDRNGTSAVLEAMQHLRTPVEVVIRAQGHVRKPSYRGPATLRIVPAAQHYWQVFDGADAALLPRRYGGLSLPLQEATAMGLPVIGLRREHDAGYDHAAVVHCTERPMTLPCGPVLRAEVDPVGLAHAIDRLYEDDEAVREMSRCSAQVAAGWSWEALGPRWEAALASVAA